MKRTYYCVEERPSYPVGSFFIQERPFRTEFELPQEKKQIRLSEIVSTVNE